MECSYYSYKKLWCYETFFREEHSALEAVGALSIGASINHTDLKASLDSMQDNLTKKLEQSLHENLVHALHTYISYERDYQESKNSNNSDTKSINAINSKETDPNILRLLDSLTKEIKALKAKVVFLLLRIQTLRIIYPPLIHVLSNLIKGTVGLMDVVIIEVIVSKP